MANASSLFGRPRPACLNVGRARSAGQGTCWWWPCCPVPAVSGWLPAWLGASFGWGIVYFSLLPAFWNGQTLGKRLLRLQVVELTGQPMTVMRCLRRYGGYAAGMATGGLGFAQALWDVNLQGIQDRTAHTVVIDLRPREPA
jgi:uncharacterized RDD family membrane protein YckC